MTLSPLELVRDRLRKQNLYGTPAYWDKKATRYQGLARSNWPSNGYNRLVHHRQLELIDQLLGDVGGLSIADVGCGTGRTAIHLAERGARVTGFDFSEKALEAARADAEKAGVSVDWELANILDPSWQAHRARFDRVLVLGCLTLACRDRADLSRALGQVTELLEPGGKLLLLEPIHASRLLRRILALPVEEWIEQGEKAGLCLESRGGVMFVPSRLLLAFREWPELMIRAVFDSGERILGWSPRLERLADYKWLLWRLGPGR